MCECFTLLHIALYCLCLYGDVRIRFLRTLYCLCDICHSQSFFFLFWERERERERERESGKLLHLNRSHPLKTDCYHIHELHYWAHALRELAYWTIASTVVSRNQWYLRDRNLLAMIWQMNFSLYKFGFINVEYQKELNWGRNGIEIIRLSVVIFGTLLL